MPKKYSGQIHIRVSPDLHEELAREAFERGLTISGICSQALAVRRALRDLDPWKSIEAVWEANKDTPLQELERDIQDAVKSVRRKSKAA